MTCVWHGWTSIIVWYQGWVYGNAEADKSQPKPALVTLQREVVENVEDKADNLVVGNVGKHFPKPAKITAVEAAVVQSTFQGSPNMSFNQ